MFRMLIGLLIFIAPTAGALALSAWLSKTSKEEWRLIAWLPPLPMVAWWIYFGVAILRDRTSHNLWPFELAIWTALSVVLYIAFFVGRRIADATRSKILP